MSVGFTAEEQGNCLFEKKLIGRIPLLCKTTPEYQVILIPVLCPFLLNSSPSHCVNTIVSSHCFLTP